MEGLDTGQVGIRRSEYLKGRRCWEQGGLVAVEPAQWKIAKKGIKFKCIVLIYQNSGVGQI